MEGNTIGPNAPIAKESPQIQKARNKLKKMLAKENTLIHETALNKMKQAIHIWIDRHQSERIDLKDRLELFDENRHPAAVQSKFVDDLAKKIANEAKARTAPKTLTGRLQKRSKTDSEYR